MTVTAICDGLTDAEAQSCTLYEVIQLHETLKYTGLLLLGDTGAGVFTIEQQTVSFSLFIEGQSALIGGYISQHWS